MCSKSVLGAPGSQPGYKAKPLPSPTIEEILYELTNAKVFSTVDLTNGFGHVASDEESPLFTTFNTPHGRFRWLRMSFGISLAQDEL